MEINKNIKAKLDKTAKYAKSNANWINRIIAFGDALTDGNEDEEVGLAVEFNEDYDIDECFENLATVVDEIFDGMFELLIMNGDNLTSNTMSEIKEGVIIYESGKTKTT